MNEARTHQDENPRKPRRVRKGLYLLPSIFTAGNIAAGYYAISQAIQGTAAAPWYFDQAAKAIGIAIVLDFFDGGIARLTNTASPFGRELDSLADVVAFGIAPATLAWTWGFRMLPVAGDSDIRARVIQLGAIATFVFLLAERAAWRGSTSRQIRSLQILAVRDVSILSACLSPQAPGPSQPWFICDRATLCKFGGSPSAGVCWSSPSLSLWSVPGGS